MKLREYQKNSVIQARQSLYKNRAIIIQGATGTGKTPIMAAICEMATVKKRRVWIIVPRTELLSQAKSHLKKYNVPHGIIDPTHNESLAYKIHVVSKDTLIRRYDRIKNPPDLILWDESHIALDQQITAYNNFPNTKFIGLTATPERGDGRGLSSQAGGIYDDLILGESIPWMMQHEYLTPCKYYAPEIEGVDDLHKKGTDVDATELEKLFERKKIYGKVIQHYRELGKEKPALVFCRDVKSAYKTADEFTQAGYKFFCIEGRMAKGKRKALIHALENGEIDGLTNCDIATYGLDIPRIEVGILLRPTFSRALYFQMIGRTLRPWQNEYYKKDHSVIIDHVNNWQEHTNPSYPTVLPLNLEHLDWNFHGVEKRKRADKNNERSLTVCSSCWQHTTGLYKCHLCGAELKKRKIQKVEIVDVKLKEIEQVKLADLPPEEKRETNDKINELIESFEADYKLGKINPGPVGDMIKLSEKLGNNIIWVYHQFTKNNVMVNSSLLHEIARQKKFKRGWVFYQKKRLSENIENDRKKMEDYSLNFG
jgi:superfamily II DNA or RNA helicase